MHPNLVAKFILSGCLVKIFTAELLISVPVAKVFIRSFFVRIFVVANWANPPLILFPSALAMMNE